ncbi:MAG: carboxypeptidase regulatory-like domain-containing protein, partial [Bryobacteraceae bacterium]
MIDSGGKPLRGAVVSAVQPDIGLSRSVETGADGVSFFSALPPGIYRLNATINGYYGPEKQGIKLDVSAKQEVTFVLDAVSKPGAENPPPLFQTVPDPVSLPVETVASTVSVVVDENKILQLPLASRNIYSLFLLQPGVTSQGASVRRGLTFSVHGQRVSGSNYLLDGVDNNNIVLTGPLAAASMEAIQEFRMVNSNFSAGHGRATSFVAQVITRSGTNDFHGGLFHYFAHDKLGANTFSNNATGQEKSALRQNQFGYSLGGPLRKNRTFFLNVLEASRLRYSGRQDLLLPTANFISSLAENSIARQLLTASPPLAVVPLPGNSSVGPVSYTIPNRIDTWLATGRVDHQFTNAQDRLVARYTLITTDQRRGEGNVGEFSGYPGLRPTDEFAAHNTLLGWNHAFRGGAVNDLRAGWSRERLLLPRPMASVPVMLTMFPNNVRLPASTRNSEQRENNNVLHVANNFSLRRGRSSWYFGAEYRRNITSGWTPGLESNVLGGSSFFAAGLYQFRDLEAFALGQPFLFGISVDRFSSGQLRLPDLYRSYRSGDFAAFVQNDLKLTRRFSLNIGLRYEYFGVPHNRDRSQDVNFYFG